MQGPSAELSAVAARGGLAVGAAAGATAGAVSGGAAGHWTNNSLAQSQVHHSKNPKKQA